MIGDRWLPALAATAVAVVASLVPLEVERSSIPATAGVRVDYLSHLLGYAAIAAAYAEGLGADRPTDSAAAGGFVAATALGTVLEVLQPRVGRVAESGDLLGHVVGAAAGTLLWAAREWRRA